MTDSITPDDADTAAAKPLLRIVGGNPTDEDVAVITALIAAAASGADADAAPAGPRDEWGRPEDRLRPVWGAPTSFTNLRR